MSGADGQDMIGASGKAAILFVDLETTGLDTQHDLILEVALVVTDKYLNELGVFEQAVRHEWDAKHSEVTVATGRFPLLVTREVGDIVRAMHTESGLFVGGMRKNTLPLASVEDEACDFLDAHFADPSLTVRKPPLAGNSIHFDRALLRRWMPTLLDRCHYRQIDVSSLKVLAGLWGGPTPPKKNAHRALADCRESIAELRFYREQRFVGGAR